MFSKPSINGKRFYSAAEEPISKRPRTVNDFLPWKFWFLQNYIFLEGGFTPIDEIIEHAKREKENVINEKPLSYSSLGKIVKDTWGESVKRIKRGPRGQQLSCYANIVRKVETAREKNPVKVEFEQMANSMEHLPQSWRKVIDSEEKVSFIRVEKWEFEEQRMSMELSAELISKNDRVSFVLKSHGISVNINELKIGKQVEDLPMSEQVIAILSFLDTSTTCLGFQVSTEESVIALKPHQIGVLKSTNEDETSTRAFSLDCKLVASNGKLCSSCRYEKKLTKIRTKRKQERNGIKKKCNKKYLTKSEVEQQLREEKKVHRNSKERETYWREKYKDFLDMEESDHTDLSSMFNDAKNNDVPEGMKCLWEQQKQMLATKNKKGYRWHPKIIRLCLELYCKNPHVLDPLRKYLILPSNKTIRLYKNKVQELAGWNDEILGWCLQEAKDRQLREEDYWGGFVIDEMKIQENLELVHRNGTHKLVGFVNLGEVHDIMSKISGGTTPQLATHVLQFIFLSDRGFRFPIAQFPSASCTPSALYFTFWDGVLKMQEYGFVIYWCILDGADVNRQFIKIHFKGEDPVEKKFVVENIYTGNPMVFIMDPKHNIKKIRNNILKSNDNSRKPRCLEIGNKTITWAQFKAAYNWDQNSFSLPVHEKLTPQHFELDPSTKMRNHLAENVLDSKMLFLMQKYKESLNESGKDGSALDSTIELLSYTSNIVNLFGDKLCISSTNDSRLTKLNTFYKFLLKWREETKSSNQSFISSKLFFDLQSMCLGFQAIVALKLEKFPSSTIKPAIVNQDCVENHFCQVRACHGQNNNPTFSQQQSAQNSIRLGQTTISRKSNSGNCSTSDFSSCSLPPACKSQKTC